MFAFHLSLWLFEGFPTTSVLVGVAAHFFYYILLRQFPKIKLTNLGFIFAMIFCILDHYVWFVYFQSKYHNFWDVTAFFVVCVWSVPFIYFLGLTSDDVILPYGSMTACMYLKRPSRDEKLII
eukprot:TRINITY_DN1978_c0_g2_i9.p1 TRINITY_DN1978_c0_g2~~TRINITY_DN1978_c0_g2_i9.p1  ORF type:complete len:123 (-),score=6.41 TRINITY_DN1978_c0_g2_i9:774-1142(-)